MLEVGVILCLIVLNGLLAGSEAGVVAARRVRLRQQASAGVWGAQRALRAVESPTGFLSSVQVGITLIGIFSGFLGAAALAPDVEVVFEPLLPERLARPAAYALVVVSITYLSLVIGELVPKRIAIEHPETVARMAAGPMLILATIASPVVRFLSFSTNVVLRPLGIGPTRSEQVSEEEIRSMIRQGGTSGVLESEEISVIERVFAAADRRVGSFMVPRRDVECLSPEASGAEIRRVVGATRDAALPVSPGGLDGLLGVVSVVDLVHAAERSIADLLRPPLFVPETANALRAIELFRSHNAQIAFVTDEHGTIEGMVRLPDLIEEILGEAGPGAPAVLDEPGVTRRQDGSLLIDGLLPLADLLDVIGERTGPEFDPSAHHTVGGLVVRALGHVPRAGEHVVIGGWRFEVMDMDGHRVDKVMATRCEERADEEAEESR